MKKKYYILLLCISQLSYSQTTVGLYVNDFKNIIGNSSAETELLNYAQTNGFNYLILYNLTYIDNNMFAIDDITTSLPLANFINTAKTSFGISQIAVVGEKNSSFDKIKAYNSFYPSEPNKRFDVFNLEFEFWNSNLTDPGEYYCTTYLTPNGLPCTNSGAFDYYNDQLILMKTYGDINNIIAETYIGSPTASQSNIIAQNTHRVLVHYYRTSDVYGNGDSIYQYNSHRIEELSTNNNVTIIPIFSAQPDHMYTWLHTNTLTQPYDIFLNGTNGYHEQTGDWKDNITFGGYTWYRYTTLLELNNTLDITTETIENKRLFYNQETNSLVLKNVKSYDQIKVYNTSGALITSFNSNEELFLPKLTVGIYVIKVIELNNIFSQKIIIH